MHWRDVNWPMGLKGGQKNKDQSRQMSRVSLREQTHLYYVIFVNQMEQGLVEGETFPGFCEEFGSKGIR